jgi:hypothetical protein
MEIPMSIQNVDFEVIVIDDVALAEVSGGTNGNEF